MNVNLFYSVYKILNKNIPTIGVWDDHDYAINDGNGYFMHKETAKKYYLDFLDEPESSERRKFNRSIYTTYAFGQGFKTVRFVLLDVRFHKQSYYVDRDPDILDEEQWSWLEDILKNNHETFTFICSGTQILPFNRILTEAWYEKSRKRLFDLIGKYKKSGIILLSGDVHFAEISKTFCTIPEIGYDLFEITSSAMTHYFSKILSDIILAKDYKVSDSINYYNFAKFDFNWGQNRDNSSVNIKIIDIDNKIRIEKELKYLDLVYNENKILNDQSCYQKINSRFKGFRQYIEYYRDNIGELLIISILVFFILTILFLIVYIPIKISLNIYSFLLNRKKIDKIE